jgi:uncharacterized Zn finger protein
MITLGPVLRLLPSIDISRIATRIGAICEHREVSKGPMNRPQLTEATIRAGATAQSLARGRDYYRQGALHGLAIRGATLTGLCTGRSAPAYRVRVELDEAGVRTAGCTCLYDWGGWCKHIVALLLAYVHEPESFVVQEPPAELLAGLDREALSGLLVRLVAERPELYDWLAAAVAALGCAGQAPARPADPALYRRRVASILRQLDGYGYDTYGLARGLVEQLGEVDDAARRFLEAGDAEMALEIWLTILDQVGSAFEIVDDSDGELGGYLMDLGLPLSEAVLSLELDEEQRGALRRRLRTLGRKLGDYGVEEGVDLALVALRHGWGDGGDDELAEARLNVLERQGRSEEYLTLCHRTGRHERYALKPCERLTSTNDVLHVAQRLRELGHASEAVALAERGLALPGERWQLAEWLAPVEEALGRKPQALEAWLVLLEECPTLAAYRAAKRLAGPAWPTVRPRAMASLESGYDKQPLAEVLLEEEQWDAAIALAEAERSDWGVREVVVAGVVRARPEWAARTSIAEAERLLVEANTSRYPVAAEWLRRAKAAYAALDRSADWRAYVEELKARYHRRRALLRELHGL